MLPSSTALEARTDWRVLNFQPLMPPMSKLSTPSVVGNPSFPSAGQSRGHRIKRIEARLYDRGRSEHG